MKNLVFIVGPCSHIGHLREFRRTGFLQGEKIWTQNFKELVNIKGFLNWLLGVLQRGDAWNVGRSWKYIERSRYLHLWCDKKTSYPNELQHPLFNVVLGHHEAVKIVLRQVERLPVKSVGLTHLVKPKTKKKVCSVILIFVS